MTERPANARQPTLRFAPSPTGYLHLGHAYSALLNADLAQRLGGRLLLRIEDIDAGRVRPAFTDAIIEDLTWLGVTWSGPVIKQSARFETYSAAAARLAALGLTYRCAATRSDIAHALADRPPTDVARDPDGAPQYTPVCAFDQTRRSCGQTKGPFATRIAVASALRHVSANASGPLGFTAWDGEAACDRRAADPSRWGDAVLVRKDTPASYHLASVVDDADQGVTHIVRGEDIAPATDLHVLLQALLDLPSPVYHHHRLLLGSDGKKLSKSNDAPSIRQMRADGATPETIRNRVGLPAACAAV